MSRALLSGIELRCRRKMLGLNQEELAGWLGVAQATVSRWEGTALLPGGNTLGEETDELETALDDIVNGYVRGAKAGAGPAVLIVEDSDEAFWAAHPDKEGVPVAVQQVAAGLAQRRLAAAGVAAHIRAGTERPNV